MIILLTLIVVMIGVIVGIILIVNGNDDNDDTSVGLAPLSSLMSVNRTLNGTGNNAGFVNRGSIG